MNYKVSFSRGPDYLHAHVTGQNSRETVLAYMDDVLAECRRRECFRVLIEECLDGPRLQALEVFSIASEGSMKVLGIFEAIAYVESNMGDLRDFVETVAVNRGMPIATFDTVADAESWLSAQRTAADEKKIFHDPGADR